ncbi:MAG: MerR family transcriptional regulator, partial [Candidatus Riflebacteria bacterium]|nr:MerR family transcriptional regulator [Candidatus Riflebacteria bacterium]
MLIKTTSKVTDLTKKAIEYYTEQGLISPAILENGYRDFNEKDVERLKKI